MDIQNAQLQLSASSQQRFSLSTHEQVTVLQPSPDTNSSPNQASPLPSSTPSEATQLTRAPNDELRLALVSQIYERLTGKQLHLFNMPEPNSDQETLTLNEEFVALEITTGQQPEMQEVRIQTETLLHREEHVTFNAHGMIQDSEGKTIKFNLDMQLSRETTEQLEINISTAFRELKDPLVVNFDKISAELSENRIQFDIDADGELDSINQLSSGSGYLALDKNKNGIIDDGTELFGALSGNGFSDLSSYDSNADGRIDSNDAVYNQLQIWVQEAPKDQQLISLKEKNIDSLFLAHTPTPFELYAGNNQQEPAGIIRATGVYLTENGQVGTLQQIDLFT